MRKTPKGFTLVELLIATLLLSVISAAVFSVFTRGMALWKRGEAMGLVERDADFLTDRLATEFRNGSPFPSVPFEGSPQTLSFPALTASQDGGKSGLGLARVVYSFDPARGVFYRGESSYAELFADREGLPAAGVAMKPAIEHVADAKISYYAFNKKAMKLEWSDSWAVKNKFPMGIRVEIVLDGKRGGRRIVRTVYAPIPR